MCSEFSPSWNFAGFGCLPHEGREEIRGWITSGCLQAHAQALAFVPSSTEAWLLAAIGAARILLCSPGSYSRMAGRIGAKRNAHIARPGPLLRDARAGFEILRVGEVSLIFKYRRNCLLSCRPIVYLAWFSKKQKTRRDSRF